MNKVELLEDGNQQIVNFPLPTKAQLIMRAHTEKRHQQKHGAKQLMETSGIVMKDAQEFKIHFL